MTQQRLKKNAGVFERCTGNSPKSIRRACLPFIQAGICIMTDKRTAVWFSPAKALIETLRVEERDKRNRTAA